MESRYSVKGSQALANSRKPRELPSEGRGQGFESLRVRQIAILDCIKKSATGSGRIIFCACGRTRGLFETAHPLPLLDETFVRRWQTIGRHGSPWTPETARACALQPSGML